MTLVDTSVPAFFDRAASAFLRVTRIFAARTAASSPGHTGDTGDTGDDARLRRAFIQEMLSRNPDAFSSDLDLQAMMQHYPASF